MDAEIIAMLGQDGITNGAIYALLALALVLVFAVTRVIFIPQGEFLAWGALTMAALEGGQFPATVWLLVGCGALTLAVDLFSATGRRTIGRSVLWNLLYPLARAGLLWVLPLAALSTWARVLVTLAIVVPMGPMIYRLAFEPLAEASVLVLLIASFGVHFSLTGLGLDGEDGILGFAHPSGVFFSFSHFEQFKRILQLPLNHAVAVDGFVQLGAFAHHFLRFGAVIPDGGIFGEGIQLFKTTCGLVEVKDASSADPATSECR